jgi:hypothetical protein
LVLIQNSAITGERSQTESQTDSQNVLRIWRR